MEEYTNANGEVCTFTKQGINKVLMEGNFKDHRVGGKPGDIEYINPRGGPFIKKGQTITGIDFNGIVKTFERLDNGYIINVREIEVDPNDFSCLEDGNYIGGLTMPEEKSNYWKMENKNIS